MREKLRGEKDEKESVKGRKIERIQAIQRQRIREIKRGREHERMQMRERGDTEEEDKRQRKRLRRSERMSDTTEGCNLNHQILLGRDRNY